ncbi:MAG: hypothetical protein AAF927_33190 [Bacteroidota bacterium]
MRNTAKLSPLQLELLKVYSFDPTEEELLEIRKYLGKFFAHRLAEKVGNAAKKQGVTEEDLEAWLNGEAQ